MTVASDAELGTAGAPDPSSGIWGRVRSSPVVRYLAVGGSAFLVDLGLLALFHEAFGWTLWVATGSAFLLSFVYTYTLQRLAFGSKLPHGRALLRYTLLVGANTVVTAVLVSVASPVVGWVAAKVLTTAITTVWNFFAYKYWVFATPTTGHRALDGHEEAP